MLFISLYFGPFVLFYNEPAQARLPETVQANVFPGPSTRARKAYRPVARTRIM